MEQEAIYDVLVVGSGIAGTAAALTAAETRPRATVAIASIAPLFSGSSFATTTWALGLISPGLDPGEQDDLARRILEVGCGKASEELVREFVSGIEAAVRRAQSWGVDFLEPSPEAQGEQEYIACFDDSMRHWRGLVRSSWRKAIGPLLEKRSVTALESCELLDLDLLEDGKSVATFYSHRDHAFFQTRQASIVLATGGTASLWPKSISGADAQATVHAIACRLGATCTNMESIQFMPTIVSPVDNVVFNEKAFRFMEFPASVVREIELELPEGVTYLDALRERSGYGPYSERLASNAIDRAICNAGPDGLALVPRIGHDMPELVSRYLDWLSCDHGVSADAPLRVAIRAQASNGGIAIRADGNTGIPGVYAAGECTGGMHGQDRIGGLSSANALTFGIRAGEAAARYSEQIACHQDGHKNRSQTTQKPAQADQMPAWTRQTPTLIGHKTTESQPELTGTEPTWLGRASHDWREVEDELEAIMEASFGPLREATGIAEGRRMLAQLADKLASSAEPSADPKAIVLSRRTRLRIETAQEIAQSASV